MSLPIAGSRRYAEKLFLKGRYFPRGNALVFKLIDGYTREIAHSSYPEQSRPQLRAWEFHTKEGFSKVKHWKL